MRELRVLAEEVNTEFAARGDEWHEARWRRLAADPGARLPVKTQRFQWWAPGPLVAACAAAALLFWVVPKALDWNSADDDGQWIQAQSTARTHNVDDGSSLKFAPGAAGRLNEDQDRVRFELTQGDVKFSVNPLRKRQWKVYAGPFLVEVVGTVFHVDYDPSDKSASVRVERGVVHVTGPGAPSPVRLTAGDSLEGTMGQVEVRRGRQDPAAEAAPEDRSEQTTDAPAPSGAAVAPVVKGSAPSAEAERIDFRHLYTQGKYKEALADAKRIGIEKLLGELDLNGTWALADTARLGGDVALASRIWRQLRKESPGTDLSARAAFMLGRQADKAGSSAEAERLFLAYLNERSGDQYSAEATGRLMDVYRRTGRTAEAKEMAARYLKLAPRGAYGDVARSLMLP